MILWIFLTILAAWLVLMGVYWFHGRKGIGIDGNHPASKGFFIDSLRRSLNFDISQPNYMEQFISSCEEDENGAKIVPSSSRKGVGSVCRSCGKVIGFGEDTCSDCYGDPHHEG